jgi:hypothetical protein
MYSIPINMLESYSDDNVKLALKHASLTTRFHPVWFTYLRSFDIFFYF